MLYGVVRGTKYGRFTSINISKYEYLTRKISIIYLHLLCPLWFPAFFAVLRLLCHHYYSFYMTRSRLYTSMILLYNRNNSDGKARLKRQRMPETTTDTQDVSKFY